MKKIILSIVLALAPLVVLGATGGECGRVPCQKADVDLNNLAAVQRGAKYFVNYCMGCHSMKYMSYGRLGRDLQLSKEQVFENLYFPTADGKKKLANYMHASMTSDQAEKFFGVTPPDLTLAARNRGPDWLYTYLKAFYVDKDKKFGVNNMVFKDVGMPDVLWSLEGMKKANFEQIKKENGETHSEFKGYEKVSDGRMSDVEYDRMVRDLVTFLAYAGEPGKMAHRHLGVWVLLFLVIFAAIAYMLKKEFWKDVH